MISNAWASRIVDSSTDQAWPSIAAAYSLNANRRFHVIHWLYRDPLNPFLVPRQWVRDFMSRLAQCKGILENLIDRTHKSAVKSRGMEQLKSLAAGIARIYAAFPVSWPNDQRRNLMALWRANCAEFANNSANRDIRANAWHSLRRGTTRCSFSKLLRDN